MKGIVLAGGTATRLYPLTTVTNKHLLPLYDRPMIYYPLETLAGMGITEVLLILGGRSVGDIVELLGDGSQFGFDLTYRYQRGALGIAHGIGLARKWVGRDDFCVVLGDNILRGPSLDGVAREFSHSVCGAGTLLYEVPDPERFGVAEFDGDGHVVRFEEKPARPKSNLIPIGVYLLRPEVFGVIERLKPSARGEFEITDVLNHYIPRDGLYWHRYTGQWIDAGTVPSLLRAAEMVEADARRGMLVPPVQASSGAPVKISLPLLSGNGHNGHGDVPLSGVLAGAHAPESA
ncbi:MAG TPA: sugar phosphate nucleotidyltransferase [Candidatus Limnocylindria bacterium]|nr:sugar phosphate nucleotidyltransferase [Candidatus Limnocylindria bacterium]